MKKYAFGLMFALIAMPLLFNIVTSISPSSVLFLGFGIAAFLAVWNTQ